MIYAIHAFQSLIEWLRHLTFYRNIKYISTFIKFSFFICIFFKTTIWRNLEKKCFNEKGGYSILAMPANACSYVIFYQTRQFGVLPCIFVSNDVLLYKPWLVVSRDCHNGQYDPYAIPPEITPRDSYSAKRVNQNEILVAISCWRASLKKSPVLDKHE